MDESGIPGAPSSKNRYVAALPALCSLAERREALARTPLLSAADRSLTPAERRYRVLALFDYFMPNARNLRISEGIDMMIRKGYEDRDPGKGRFQRRALALSGRGAGRDLLFHKAAETQAAPLTGALLGAPGMGKTRTVDLTLARYTQVVRHEKLPTQVVWLKLECPKRGSVRALCIQFLTKMSSLVGNTDYLELYGVGTWTEGEVQSIMALVASFHGLGLLVIDEIQHIGRSLDGEHELMTFLTGLSNELGIPLLVIGTLSAMGKIQATARMARRSVGLASAIWQPLPFEAEWLAHLRSLWPYQWISPPTPLTDELCEAFFECTGGIIDLMIKLFIAVQMRLLYRTEVRGGSDEVITPAFIRNVAKIDFQPVRHIVKALASGNRAKISRFDDLHAFDESFRSALQQIVKAGPADQTRAVSIPAAVNTSSSGNAYEMVWAKLRDLGVPDEAIVMLIDQARGEGLDPARDVLGFYSRVLELMRSRKRAKTAKPTDMGELPGDDLRRLLPEAADRGLNPIEALREANLGGIWPIVSPRRAD